MRILGIETSCDETAAAVVEEVDDAARPWVVDGSVVPRQVITLSLGADHRVTDGRLGAQFLAALARRVCNPATL